MRTHKRTHNTFAVCLYEAFHSKAFVYTYICICMYVCVCVCVYIYIYICIYVCMYIYEQTQTHINTYTHIRTHKRMYNNFVCSSTFHSRILWRLFLPLNTSIHTNKNSHTSACTAPSFALRLFIRWSFGTFSSFFPVTCVCFCVYIYIDAYACTCMCSCVFVCYKIFTCACMCVCVCVC